MASTPTRGFRRPPSPGRDRTRARAGARPSVMPNKREQLVGKISEGFTENLSPQARRITITKRLLIVIAIFTLLLISYMKSMQVYITQQHDLAAANARIVEQQKRIDTLSQDIKRWEDPAYIRAQARSRLGWILPGETGYQVLDDQGRILGDGANLTGNIDDKAAWWERMWGTLKVADKPT